MQQALPLDAKARGRRDSIKRDGQTKSTHVDCWACEYPAQSLFNSCRCSFAFVCMHVHNVYVCTYIHTYMYKDMIFSSVNACMYAYMHLYVHTYIDVDTYVSCIWSLDLRIPPSAEVSCNMRPQMQ